MALGHTLVSALLAAALGAAATHLADAHAPIRPDDPAFEVTDVVAHVVPGADELRWRSIPWRPSLSAGMRDGARLDRPVLLWAVNGHPLGST
ncbi:MAG: hypothetical protein AAFU73_00995 [Planctomycetota bacterium]